MTIAQIPITDVNNLRLIRMHEIYLREWTAGNFVSLPSQYPTPGGFPMWDIDRTSTSVGVILSATPKVRLGSALSYLCLSTGTRVTDAL